MAKTMAGPFTGLKGNEVCSNRYPQEECPLGAAAEGFRFDSNGSRPHAVLALLYPK